MPTSVIDFPRSFGIAKQTVPSLVPTAAAEDLVTSDAYLDYAYFSNKGNADQTVTLKDKQGTPREIMPATVIPAGKSVFFIFDRYYCPGGFNWIASDATSIIGYVRWRQ